MVARGEVVLIEFPYVDRAHRKNPSRIGHSMRPQQLPAAEHGGGNDHRERSVCENRANASAG